MSSVVFVAIRIIRTHSYIGICIRYPHFANTPLS
jgi:hypothetical protein